MGHIFISYSRKDEEYVNRLVESLENEGFEVWIDRALLTGDTWTQVINHKIDTCDAFVVVMTDSSKESKWVNREVLYALQEGKKIFPLLLQGKLWMLLQDFNYFKVTDGLTPDRKFFKDIEKTVPRSEAWLKSQREAAEKAAREKSRLQAEKLERQKAEKEKNDREESGRKRKEKGLREKQVREGREEAKRVTEKKEEKPVAVKPKSGGQIVYWFGGFIILVFGAIFFSRLTNSLKPEPTLVIKPSQVFTTSTKTETSTPSTTPSPEPTLTYTVTSTSTPVPSRITDSKGVPMALVPAGNFIMGSKNGDVDEVSVHEVYLNDFYIDIFEVTNALYNVCISDGVCGVPNSGYYQYSDYSDHPVVNVTWAQADQYCKWRGGYLPTEAQWEKTARGGDERTYPWGEEVDCSKANYRTCVGNTAKIGSYESGKSPYGVYDLAGNVWEWVADWYDDNYYQYSPSSNPLGPTSGKYRVIRGGSWSFRIDDLPAYNRRESDPDSDRNTIGFRCAKDVP